MVGMERVLSRRVFEQPQSFRCERRVVLHLWKRPELVADIPRHSHRTRSAGSVGQSCAKATHRQQLLAFVEAEDGNSRSAA